MKYIKVKWIHDSEDDPIEFYSELDSEMWEKRKVEVFRDGRLKYGAASEGFTDDFIALVPLPTLEEINRETVFNGIEISRNEFEEMWLKALRES